MKKKYIKRLLSFALAFGMLMPCSVQAKQVNEDIDPDLYLQSIADEIDSDINKEKDIKNELSKIENLLPQIEKNIESKKQDYMNIQKEIVAKEMQNKQSLKKNNLQILNMILNSESFGDFLKNLSLSEKIMKIHNSSLTNVEKQKDISLSQYKALTDKQNAIIAKRDSLDKEDRELVTKIESLKAKKNSLEKEEKARIAKIGYDCNNVLKRSYITVKEAQKALSGTALESLAGVYVKAEKITGINAFFIMGLTAEESGWGESQRAKNDNNLTGFGVFSNSSIGINAISKEANILQTAAWIKEQYLSPGGNYFHGQSARDINTAYCKGADGQTDYGWSERISSISNRLVQKVRAK